MKDSELCHPSPLHVIQANPVNDKAICALKFMLLNRFCVYAPVCIVHFAVVSVSPSLGQFCKIQTIPIPPGQPLYHFRI